MLLMYYRFDLSFVSFSWFCDKANPRVSECTLHPLQTLQEVGPEENYILASFKSNLIYLQPNKNISDVARSFNTYIPGEMNVPATIFRVLFYTAYYRSAPDFCREVTSVNRIFSLIHLLHTVKLQHS